MKNKLFDAGTPALLLDVGRMAGNTQTMRRRLHDLGVTLRPHVKTAKCAEIAALQADQTGAVTVSTLREAEALFAREFFDILYAVGIHPGRFPRVLRLLERGALVTVITDDLPTVNQLALFMRDQAVKLRVMIEIDTGDGRAGLLPADPAIIEIGRQLHGSPNLILQGVMTHAGHSYRCSGPDEIRQVAEQERRGIVAAATVLREAGLPCPVVSAGSTPTARFAADLSGVTEMRPGVYVFYDRFQESIGVCTQDDLALSVLSTVIGHNRHRGHLLIDAGALALSKDTGRTGLQGEPNYGQVCAAADLRLFDGLVVQRVSQEHGEIPVSGADCFDALPVGAQVRVLPNHACITAAAYKHYHLVDNGAITAVWKRTGGW